MEEEVNVISDDECDVGARTSTSRTSIRTFLHVAAHREDVSTPTSAVCDSCQFCNDVCDVPNCVQCQSKTILPQAPRSYTMCQIRRHNNIDQSVWIVADDTVYDVTSYIQHHPGGMECILKKAGGKHNCRRDLQFHSQRGQQLFNKYAIGKVVACPGCVVASDSSSGNLNGSNANTTTTSRPSMLAALEKHRWFLW
jgi:cytochrome b involved in lipid metabolism